MDIHVPHTISPVRELLGTQREFSDFRLVNAGFYLGRLGINCKDAADVMGVAGLVVEVAGYVQRYRGAEGVALDMHPVPTTLKTG